MARLIVVSNRMAVPGSDAVNRAGGLEVALRALVARNHGVWIGWSGKIAKGPIVPQTVERDGVTFITTDLTREDYDEYYLGFSNRALWPIFHFRLDLMEFSNRDFNGYMRVNSHFAEILHKILKPDDMVWVHDYHLIPLAKALRDYGHRNRIGFYLHVPFPSVEVITALPKHERLISSLCHYDLVGFQVDGYADNLARYFSAECQMQSTAPRVFAAGKRAVQIGVFPVGVEMTEFKRLAERAMRSSFVREVAESMAGRALIIGVDRLDYSKGIDQRIVAFGRFLDKNPQWHRAVTYLQITPRSRSEIREYADMARQIGEIVGRVNGAYGEAAWTPVRYVNRSYGRSALAGLFRLSRAALVTPLRDGMNLVAQEYVAAQNPNDPGVLILSRFAGAALKCKAALLVNPYDVDAVGDAVAQALSMPEQERRQRYDELFKNLADIDIRSWGDRFISALQETGRERAAA